MHLANTLVSRGHHVIVWSSDFFHQEKRYRFGEPTSIKISRQLEIRLIPSIGYKRNMGFGRLADHAQLALNLRRWLKQESLRPDVVFIGYPPIEFAAVAAYWAKEQSIPSMLDGKDQWPEIFVAHFPAILKPLARAAFLPYFILGRKAMRNATALSTISESFLAWMRRFSCRTQHPLDGVFPLSPMEEHFSNEELIEAERWWAERGVKNDERKRFFFVGSLSQAFDFETIREAASLLSQPSKGWQFVICGDGGAANEIKKLFKGLENVVFPGWTDRKKVRALSRMSIAGLAPYRNTQDFQNSIPNKIIDYLSMAQPIVTPLEGEVGCLINQHSVGLSYLDSSPESLAKCLSDIAQDEQLRGLLSKNAEELYRMKFAGEEVYASLADRLEQLAADGQGNRYNQSNCR